MLPLQGFVYPTAAFKEIIDKTAAYVAKNGEKKILESEKDNAKFSFLKPSNQFYPYYQHKIAEIKQEMATAQIAAQQKAKQGEHAVKPFFLTLTALFYALRRPLICLLCTLFRPKVPAKPAKTLVTPEPDRFTISPIKSLTPTDFDIIKVTAQFVARNGIPFLKALSEREQTNPQFDFLKVFACLSLLSS